MSSSVISKKYSEIKKKGKSFTKRTFEAEIKNSLRPLKKNLTFQSHKKPMSRTPKATTRYKQHRNLLKQ